MSIEPFSSSVLAIDIQGNRFGMHSMEWNVVEPGSSLMIMNNEQRASIAIEVAQSALTQSFHGPIQLEAVEVLQGSDRSRVTRCRVVDAGGAAPPFVVVKQALAQGEEIYDPDSGRGASARLFNEWASLQFLGECFGPGTEDSPVPRFYGGSREAGLLVMEDLGEGQGLHTLLQGNEATVAADALVDLFCVLGRIHAVSVGKAARYQALHNALGPTSPRAGDFTRDATGLAACLAALGQEISVQVEAEVHRCGQMTHEAGSFAALIHGDPCPDNCLLTPTGMKVLDFEFGQFGLALWDGTYARMHFPTCWCVGRIPLPVIERAEAAYRSELAQGCPEARDDAQFGSALVVGSAQALLLTLAWTMPALLEQDGRWGIATVRQRVLVRLDAFARASEQWGQLPALGAVARRIESRLKDLWAQEMEEMPLYPAFQ